MELQDSAQPDTIHILAPIYAKLLAHHILSKMASQGDGKSNPLRLFPRIEEVALATQLKFREIKKLAMQVTPFYHYEIAAINGVKMELDRILDKANITYENFRTNAANFLHKGALTFVAYYDILSEERIQQAIEKSGEYIINASAKEAYIHIFKTVSHFCELLELGLEVVVKYEQAYNALSGDPDYDVFLYDHKHDAFFAEAFLYFVIISTLYLFNALLKMSAKRTRADEVKIMLLSYLGYSNYFVHLSMKSDKPSVMFLMADPDILQYAYSFFAKVTKLGKEIQTFNQLQEGIALNLVDTEYADIIEKGLSLLFTC